MADGIIFADYFIEDKSSFVKFFSEYYIENEARLKPVIMDLEGVLNQYTSKTVTAEMASSFKTAWKNFQQIVLLNDADLQLLVAYRGAGGMNATFSQIVKQADVEGVEQTEYGRRYGIKAGDDLIRDTMAALKASEVEKFLQAHLNDFLNQLETSITRSEAEKIHDYHEYCLSSYLQNTDIHITGMRFREAFYSQKAGHYFGGQGLGQAYDAFMNHMADRESWIYDYLSSGGASGGSDFSSTIETVRNSVYIEEGGVEASGTFPELLHASKNHVGWYTGGDIIIVNPETMQVVYNIQLKTTTANKASVFAERVEKIRGFLRGFLDLTPQQKGERIFDFFLTSVSNASDFNNAPDRDIDKLLKQAFSEKKINIITPIY